ncbi:MAG: hypothetical protein KF851_03765 [Pirellulaceae bacterium]|nr:hypothetical protein [Pirellulaceae bacterium]
MQSKIDKAILAMKSTLSPRHTLRRTAQAQHAMTNNGGYEGVHFHFVFLGYTASDDQQTV